MSSIFYDYYVDWEAAEVQLHAVAPSHQEYQQLAELLDQTTHHDLFAVILTILPKQAHAAFLQGVQERPFGPEHAATLRIYDPNIEDRLRRAAAQSHKQFFDAIHAPDVIP